MCLIIASPKGWTEIPTEHIRNGFIENPDGAGFAYATGRAVVIEKGFFSTRELERALYSVPPRAPIIIHLRLASSGSIDSEHCHPFPISASYDLLCATRVITLRAIAHNGVIPEYGAKGWGPSDTQEFIMCVLARLPKMPGKLLKAFGRWALIDASGNITLYGEFLRRGKVYYSNDSFEEPRYKRGWWRLNKIGGWHVLQDDDLRTADDQDDTLSPLQGKVS